MDLCPLSIAPITPIVLIVPNEGVGGLVLAGEGVWLQIVTRKGKSVDAPFSFNIDKSVLKQT